MTKPREKPAGEHGKDYVYCDLCGAPIPFTPGTEFYVLQPCRVTVDGPQSPGMGEYLCGGCVLELHGGPEGVQY